MPPTNPYARSKTPTPPPGSSPSSNGSQATTKKKVNPYASKVTAANFSSSSHVEKQKLRQSQEKKEEFVFTPSTVALSPLYHANVPMPICLLHSRLLRIDREIGTFFLTVEDPPENMERCNDNVGKGDVDKNKTSENKKPRGLPLQKVKITGTLVMVHRKKHLNLIIDDGTGLIDCTVFGNQLLDEFLEDFTSLFVEDGGGSDPMIGDLVTVCGKIKLVTRLSPTDATDLSEPTGDTFQKEILVHSLKIHPHSSNIEAEAMIQQKLVNVPQFSRALSSTKLEMKEKKFDGSASRRYGKYKCKQCEHLGLVYSERLGGYCHCNAEKIKEDPELIFRDSLLKLLCGWEDEIITEEDKKKKDGEGEEKKFLSFGYGRITSHDGLQVEAKKVYSSLCKTNLSVKEGPFIKFLFRKTFASLKNDKVLEIQDEDTDNYLFMSRRTREEDEDAGAFGAHGEEEAWWAK